MKGVDAITCANATGSFGTMFNLIYEGQDDYEPEQSDSKPICHAIQPLNASTTGDELAGSPSFLPTDRSGLLSQLLQTVFGDTTVLGGVEEMIGHAVAVADDISPMEGADTTTCTEK